MTTTLRVPRAILVAAVLSLIASPGLARAGSPDGITVTLSADDDQEAVDLAFERTLLDTPAGLGAVHRAIGGAAAHVCAAYLGPAAADQAECRSNAAAEAERSLEVAIAARSGGARYAAR